MITKLCSYLLLVILMMDCLTACTVVEPWDRNYLAEESMNVNSDPLGMYWKYRAHSDREGTEGASGINTGGCGCT